MQQLHRPDIYCTLTNEMKSLCENYHTLRIAIIEFVKNIDISSQYFIGWKCFFSDKCVDIFRAFKSEAQGVATVGLISQARLCQDPDSIQMTPGVNLSTQSDSLGQVLPVLACDDSFILIYNARYFQRMFFCRLMWVSKRLFAKRGPTLSLLEGGSPILQVLISPQPPESTGTKPGLHTPGGLIALTISEKCK